MKPIGYQVANTLTGEHWNDRASYLILTLETAVSDLQEAAKKTSCGTYSMVAIMDGDIEKPTFEQVCNSDLMQIDLHDVYGAKPDLGISLSTGVDNSLYIQANGYSDNSSDDNQGVPIIIENVDGNLTARLFTDINQQDPTHVIPFTNARNEARQTQE